jgi:hypothetical protein
MLNILPANGRKFWLCVGVAIAASVSALPGSEAMAQVPSHCYSYSAKGVYLNGDYYEECLAEAASTNQVATNVSGKVLTGLSQQIADIAFGGGSVMSAAPATTASPISMFMVSGVTQTEHDGFVASSALFGGKSSTPEFDQTDIGLTIGTRIDVSKGFGYAPGSVTLGVLGNYTKTDIDLGESLGLAKSGTIDVDSWSVGGYSLVTDGRRYGLLTVNGTFGSPETHDAALGTDANFDTSGVAVSAATGIILPVGGAQLDLRGGLNYLSVSADDYRDSAGTHYTDAHLRDFSGSASARLFSVVRTERGTLRPFIQGGLSQRFGHDSEVTVNGEKFSFDDADTTLFGRAGVDVEVSSATQAYFAVRGDKSDDMSAISGQVGITFKLD